MKKNECLRYNIRFKNIESSEEIKDYVENKIVSRIRKYFDDSSTIVNISLIDVNGPKGGIDKQVSIVVTVKKINKPIKITQKNAYINESIDLAGERLEKILRREKDKIVKNTKTFK